METSEYLYVVLQALTLAQAQEWRETDNRAYYIDQLLTKADMRAIPYHMARVEEQFGHLLRRDNERQILEKLVDDALAVGCTVSVYDGEDWPLKRSQDRAAILEATRSTDADVLAFYGVDGEKIGNVWLIYGNDYDLISDCSEGEALQALLNGAEALAEALCEASHR